jgi:protein gp37
MDSTLRLWDPETGTEVARVNLYGWCYAMRVARRRARDRQQKKHRPKKTGAARTGGAS